MLTMADPIRHAARTAATRTAVVCGADALPYATLHRRVQQLAGGLRAAGLRRGDRVAVLALNCHRYLEAYLAVPAAGLVVVPLNTRLAPAELARILQHCGARALLTDRDPGALAAEVELVVAMPEGYEALVAGAPAAPPGELGALGALGDGVAESDLAAIFYTGGTTGSPKGVMLTHRNLVANAFHKSMACRLVPDDVLLAAGPLFHVAGTAPLLGLAWQGACVVMLPTFDPAGALDLVERHAVTVTLPVPTMVAALADEQLRQPRDVGSLRLLGHAGSPIAGEVVRRAHAAFPGAELAHFYGATETAPIVTCLPHEERHLDGPLLGSCGQPVPGVEVRIGAPGAAPGDVGEVLVRGPNVMAGYWDDPEATAAALRDGWYHTGDLGYLDEDSHLFLVDRLKDMIVTGGENVYSAEVEDVIARHPAVLEVAVFGIPDPRWGEAVHAVVTVRPDVDPATLPGLLRAHCRQAIAGFKVPKQIEVRTTPLPKSGPGKILKRSLRAPHWEGHEVPLG